VSLYLSIYLKSQDYGDLGAEAQGRLTMNIILYPVLYVMYCLNILAGDFMILDLFCALSIV